MSHEAIALWTDSSSDPELIAGVRAGDAAAFGVLYERHVEAARKVAAQYTNTPSDIDDVVSESFSRVLRALQRGDGPDLAFRAYLFTIVRRTGMDVINRGARTRPREDMGEYEAALGYGASSEEPTMDGFEQGLVADAFRSLPERWQAVLWYTEVEKKSPKEIAPLLGLSANGVAALAYRAREALRQAYLQQHLATSDQVDCLEANAQLGAYVRGGLSKRETSRVDVHVKSCERCKALVAELEDVNRGMRGIIAPLVMGVLGVGALEGGLPIGGALGAGAAGAATGSGATAGGAGASSTGAGAASGSAATASATSVSGVAAGAAGAGGLAAAGTAATAGTVAGFLGTAASLALPIAATVGVVALAATGASYFGLFGPGDEPAAAPSTTASASSSPAESPAAVASTGSSAAPEASAEPESTVELPESAPAVAAPVIELGGTSTGGTTGTGTGGTTSGSTSSDDDTDDSASEGGAEEPEPEETSEPETTPEPEPSTVAPTTPPEPPTVFASLSIKQAPLGFLSISSSAPSVPVTVANDGDGTAEDVTAEIALPAGLTFSTPDAGGVGFTVLPSELLGDYLTFAEAGTFEAGAWECTLSDDRAIASCALENLGSGESTTLDLDVDIVGSLASDATTSFTVSDGTDVHEYTVRTGLSSASSVLVPAFWTSGQVEATQVGASLLECQDGDHSCEHAAEFSGNSALTSMNGSNYDLVAADAIAGRDASNVTELDIPAGATVEYAVLEWAASSSLHGTAFDSPTAEAKLLLPGSADLVDITADDVDITTDPKGRAVYQARLDVTDLVAAAGAGTYGLADAALAADTHDSAGDRDYYAGFTLTVVYSDASLPEASVAVYEGSQWVVPGTVARLDLFARESSDVAVGVVGWGGARGTLGEQFDIDGDTLAPLHWKNGSVSTGDSGNAMDSTAFGFANPNSFGVDAKSFRDKHVGTGMHTMTVRGSADIYLLGSVTFTAVHD